MSEKLRTALEEFLNTTAPAATPAFKDPTYGDVVEDLGERIGYGALISSASASWRESAKRNGYPAGGEFVVGPCMSVLLRTRALAIDALADEAYSDLLRTSTAFIEELKAFGYGESSEKALPGSFEPFRDAVERMKG